MSNYGQPIFYSQSDVGGIVMSCWNYIIPNVWGRDCIMEEYTLAEMMWKIDNEQKLHDFATTFNNLYKVKCDHLKRLKEIEEKYENNRNYL